MVARKKRKDGRTVYRREERSCTAGKIKVGVLAFIAGVTLTLMLYPVIRR